jgi:hypothetical protein
MIVLAKTLFVITVIMCMAMIVGVLYYTLLLGILWFLEHEDELENDLKEIERKLEKLGKYIR